MSKNNIESTMEEVFVKNAPFQIPNNGRKAIVEWLPWISLVGGLISLFASLGLWQAGHAVDRLIDSTNVYLQQLGAGNQSSVAGLGVTFYVALLALVVQGAIMLYAFPGLRAKSKNAGWNILLYSTGLNLIYGIFVAFTNYGSFSNLIFSIIGVVIGLYILAQIKDQYKTSKKQVSTKPTSSKE